MADEARARIDTPLDPTRVGAGRHFVNLEVVDTHPDQNISDVSPTDAGAQESLEAQVAGLAAERDKLAAERAEVEDRLLRARADFDNYRRRVDRERSDFVQYSAMETVKDVLPVVDDFERALKVETADREYAKGVELIYQRLLEILKKAGLERIPTAGQRFDPNLHEAVQRVETRDAEDQAILDEFQAGYTFKGKLLRPAMVKVAVRP